MSANGGFRRGGKNGTANCIYGVGIKEKEMLTPTVVAIPIFALLIAAEAWLIKRENRAV